MRTIRKNAAALSGTTNHMSTMLVAMRPNIQTEELQANNLGKLGNIPPILSIRPNAAPVSGYILPNYGQIQPNPIQPTLQPNPVWPQYPVSNSSDIDALISSHNKSHYDLAEALIYDTYEPRDGSSSVTGRWSNSMTPLSSRAKSPLPSRSNDMTQPLPSRSNDIMSNDMTQPSPSRSNDRPPRKLAKNHPRKWVNGKQLSKNATQRLEAIYAIDAYPGRSTKEAMANELGIKYGRLVNWFWRRRRRSKIKMQLQATPPRSMTQPSPSRSNDMTKPSPSMRWKQLSKNATQRLEEIYAIDAYPGRSTMEAVANELGIKYGRLENWFWRRRRRSKIKMQLQATPPRRLDAVTGLLE